MKSVETSCQQIRKPIQRVLIGLIIFLLCGVCFLPAPAARSVQAQSNETPTPIPNNFEILFDQVPAVVFVMLSDGSGDNLTFNPDSNSLGMILPVGTYDVLAIFTQADKSGPTEVAIVSESHIAIPHTNQIDIFASEATYTTESFLRSLEGQPIPIPSMDILFSDLSITRSGDFFHNLSLHNKPPDIVRFSDMNDEYFIEYKVIARDRYPGVLLDLSFLAQNFQADLTLWNDFKDLDMLDLHYDQPLPRGTVHAWYILQSDWPEFMDEHQLIMLESDISSPWNFTIFQQPETIKNNSLPLRSVILANATSGEPSGVLGGEPIHATPYFFLDTHQRSSFLYNFRTGFFEATANIQSKLDLEPIKPGTSSHYNMTGSPIFFTGSLSNTPDTIRLNSDLGLYGFPGSLFRNSNYDLVWDEALLMVQRTDGQSETHTIGKYLPREGYSISAKDLNGMLLMYPYENDRGESLGAVNFIIDHAQSNPDKSDRDPAWIHQMTILNEDGQYSDRISPRDIIQLDLRDHNAIRDVTLAWRCKAGISDEFNILAGEMIRNGVYNFSLASLPADTTIDLYLEIIDVEENYFILELRNAFYIHSAPGREPVQPTAEAK